ncbi:hypothetical protein BGX38DRAFT_1251106 [Terfezia claveryi]|nr:hypothetical protein BGX38DRAFT_1251106 [Terfezia claveryi]
MPVSRRTAWTLKNINRRLNRCNATATLLSSPTPSALIQRAPETLPSYNSLTIFLAPANYTVPDPPRRTTSPNPLLGILPIYKSIDYGQTWFEISKVTDQVLNIDLSTTQTVSYASGDQGHTLEFVSYIAAGGAAIPNIGETPRDPLHGQKMAHETIEHGKNCGPVVNDVLCDVVCLPAQGYPSLLRNWITVYEYCGGTVDGNTSGNAFPVHYRVSNDPRTFDSKPGFPIVTNYSARIVPNGPPYVVIRGDGRVTVSCGSQEEVYVHRAGGVDAGESSRQSAGDRESYTRSFFAADHRE